jgi:hypothetical protein
MKFNPNFASVNLMTFTASILLADVAYLQDYTTDVNKMVRHA